MENHPQPSGEHFTAGSEVSYWTSSLPPIAYQKLSLDVDVDVVVIGGGIAGATVAYCLQESGKKVALVEDGFIGSGETGRTTAHLVTALDDRYYHLEEIFGREKTKLIAHSHSAAINFVEAIIEKEKIKCEFERLDGFLVPHPSDKPENLKKEFEAAQNAGLDVEMTSALLGGKKFERAIKFRNQAQFHPLKYLNGLCDALQRNGGRIYTGTHAKKIDHTGVESDNGFRINADHVVVATNTPVNNMYMMHLKQSAYQTYVIGAKIKKGTLPNALWWDTGDFSVNEKIPPYHYVRLQKLDDNFDLLILGGEDHPTGQQGKEKIEEKKRFGNLEKWAKENFDGIEEIVYRWSGEVMEPKDSLAFIGRNPMDKNNVFIVTGDSGNGMTHGTIAGMLLRDLITGKENALEKIYSPGRMKLKEAGLMFKEFVSAMISNLKQEPKSDDDFEFSQIGPNKGKVITFEGKKFGVYRDEKEKLHFVDAKCSHLGCSINWNDAEKTWDCPCHGSRFTYQGEVIHGPANSPLAYEAREEEKITAKQK